MCGQRLGLASVPRSRSHSGRAAPVRRQIEPRKRLRLDNSAAASWPVRGVTRSRRSLTRHHDVYKQNKHVVNREPVKRVQEYQNPWDTWDSQVAEVKAGPRCSFPGVLVSAVSRFCRKKGSGLGTCLPGKCGENGARTERYIS